MDITCFIKNIKFNSTLLTYSLLSTLSFSVIADDFGKWRKTSENLGAPVNTASGDGCNYINKNGLSLYFASKRSGGAGGNDIYVATRDSDDDDFENVTALPSWINTASNDQCPAITKDGEFLYFVSSRPGGCGGLDLYVSQRVGSGAADWGFPTHMGCDTDGGVNSNQNEEGPALYHDDDDTMLYFSSKRQSLEGNTVPGGFNIYVMDVDSDTGEAKSTPKLAASLNTDANDRRPTIRKDGDEIIFETDRAGSSKGGYNLWSISRDDDDDAFGAAIPLDNINSDQNEARPSLNRDGTELYFTSNRMGSLGKNDIYRATRKD